MAACGGTEQLGLARQPGGLEVRAERPTGKQETLQADVVVLCTGFAYARPTCLAPVEHRIHLTDDGYSVGPYQAAFDEMFDDGTVRAPYRGIYDALAPIDLEDLAARSDALARAFVAVSMPAVLGVLVSLTRRLFCTFFTPDTSSARSSALRLSRRCVTVPVKVTSESFTATSISLASR